LSLREEEPFDVNTQESHKKEKGGGGGGPHSPDLLRHEKKKTKKGNRPNKGGPVSPV